MDENHPDTSLDNGSPDGQKSKPSPFCPPELKTFLSRNPVSAISLDNECWTITKPWGDDTISLSVSFDDDSLIEALNAVYLPPQYTAIWHCESGDLEVIWTAQRVPEHLESREFCFFYDGTEYRCRFAPPSSQLRTIASAYAPLEPATATDHRNLGSFKDFGSMLIEFLRRGTDEASVRIEGPFSEAVALELVSRGGGDNVEVVRKHSEATGTSFWIHALQWEDSQVESLVRALNFYMRYYDKTSPTIVIHDSQPDDDKAIIRQFIHGTFPNKIVARDLDPHMLMLWHSADGEEPFAKYVYSYQMLEYAAFYYLREEALASVQRLMTAPDMLSRSEEVARGVLDIVTSERMGDEQKIVAVIERWADPKIVWRVITGYEEAFTSEVQFDGGFIAPVISRSSWTLEDFEAAWIPKLPDALRRIRNALVHSREARENKAIAPTRPNLSRLYPWAELIHEIAGQVAIYRG